MERKYLLEKNGKSLQIRIDFNAAKEDSPFVFLEEIEQILEKESSKYERVVIDTTNFPENGLESSGDWSKTRLEFLISMMEFYKNIEIKSNSEFFEKYKQALGPALAGTKDSYKLSY
jgi:gamma-glutamylcysteine synthetase